MQETSDLVEKIQPIVQDVEHLAKLHADLLRTEIRQSAARVTPALACIGAGAAMVATGGVLGSFAAVHGLNRSTRLPLWGCYGVVGVLFGVAGMRLLGLGRGRLSSIDFIPHETLATLQEDIAWVREKTK